MPSPFAITAPTNGVQLDEGRQAEAAFTVFNTSGRPLRARARLVPLESSAERWLTLEGEPERPLPIAGALQYSVGIKVPEEAQAGSYTFRLEVVGADNPDEEFAEGPTVTFQVPEPVVEPKKPFPWWIVAVIVGVIVVGALTYVLWPRNVEVPDVAGEPFADAVTAVQDAGLSVVEETEEEPSESIPAGVVIRTDPAIGESVRRGTPVLLVLSTGPPQTTVPDVATMTEAQATAALTEAGLTVSSTSRISDESIAAGRAIRTNPAAGTAVDPESSVALFISTGPFGSVIDDFIGTWVAVNSETVLQRLVIERVDDSTVSLRATAQSSGPIPSEFPAMNTRFSPGQLQARQTQANTTFNLTVGVADGAQRRISVRALVTIIGIIPPPITLVDETSQMQRQIRIRDDIAIPRPDDQVIQPEFPISP